MDALHHRQRRLPLHPAAVICESLQLRVAEQHTVEAGERNDLRVGDLENPELVGA